jgi:hypothetical protein
MQRQLLPHVHACSRWILAEEARRSSISHDSVSMETEVAEEQVAILDAIHRLGVLYVDQGNLAEGEDIQALKENEGTGGRRWSAEPTS